MPTNTTSEEVIIEQVVQNAPAENIPAEKKEENIDDVYARWTKKYYEVKSDSEVAAQADDRDEYNQDTLVVSKEESPVPAQPQSAPVKKLSYAQQKTKRAEELEAKVKEFEASVPTLQKKIEELESRLSEGIPKQEHLSLQERLEKLQAERDEKEAEIIRERDNLASRVEMLDFINSPTFKKQYDAPIEMHYRNIMNIVPADPSIREDINNLFVAHNAALQAQDEQARLLNFQRRDEIEQSIFDRLHASKGYRFVDAVQNLYARAQERAEAIANHSEVKKNFDKIAYEEALKRKKYWKDLYEQTGKDVSISYPEEIEKIIRLRQIDDDNKYDEEIAAAAIDEGAAKYPQQDLTRILHQGKSYKKLQAIIKAQQILIDEQRETMNKLKRAESGGGVPSSPSETVAKEVKETNLDEFLENRWGRSRMPS